MFCFARGWSVGKDGPGQRRIFYLKGCNLKCAWCANPESISRNTEILFYPDRNVNKVDYVCPFGAVVGKCIDRRICAECESRECVAKWRERCFELVGFEISPKNLVESVARERSLFGNDGGVTFGGGEPTMQFKEVGHTWDLLSTEGVNVAIETNASTIGFSKLLEKKGLFICDFKCFSENRHERWTGVGNSLILNNLRLAARECHDFLVRVPLVPGLNSDVDEMMRMSGFLAELRDIRGSLNVEVLRMHHMGAPKYAALGMKYEMENIPEPDEALKNTFLMMLNTS
jgi:pyruvate formate lyase activating enzyme